MSEPVKKRDGWYVQTEDGLSGPWGSRAAAEELSKGNVGKAHMLNYRAIQRSKVYKKGPRK